MESGAETGIREASSTSKTIVKESKTATSAMIKQTSFSSEKSVELQTSGGGVSDISTIGDISKMDASEIGKSPSAELSKQNTQMKLEIDNVASNIAADANDNSTTATVATKQHSMSSTYSSSSSSVSSVMKKSVSAVVAAETSAENDATAKASTTVDANNPEAAKDATAPQTTEEHHQKLQEIISDIDSNIQEQENIATLKYQEQELRRKQQELAQQIQQQQFLAQQLAAENRLQAQHLEQNRLQQQQQPPQQPRSLYDLQQQQQQFPYQQQQHTYQPTPQHNMTKFLTFEETQNNHGFMCKSFESEESSNITKRIDLNKIFTPATDAEEILPKSRKLYASSAFYSPALHPTVEDQVELARRISHSLSDISNQTSKGQSMYVNRKKRSVKWVHEGCGQGKADELDYASEDFKENNDTYNKQNNDIATSQQQQAPLEKLPLRLLMNPRGQMRDFNSLRDTLNTETGLLSPDKCAELVTALQTQKGRGAELFAKRRSKAEKWVVDETNAGTQSPSGLPDYHQYQPKPSTSPSILPAYSDAGKHRVQLNMHQEQLLEKYAKPGLKVVKTPWEAALETGSASTAFVEEQKPYSPIHHLLQMPPAAVRALTPISQYQPHEQQYQQDFNRGPSPYSANTGGSTPGYSKSNDIAVPPHKLPQATPYQQKPILSNNQRDLAYKPSLPQGWKAPSVSLPKELYLPKEIPLESYAPPPAVNIKDIGSQYPFAQPAWSAGGDIVAPSTYALAPTLVYGAPAQPSTGSAGGIDDGYYAPSPKTTSTYAVPSKQRQWALNSYQKVPQQNQTVPQVNFNPSPLPYDKLAKFENPAEQQLQSSYYNPTPQRHLVVQSPAPFITGFLPATQQQQHYGGNSHVSTPGSGSSPRISSSDLLHGQNFNTAARGWRSGSSGVGLDGGSNYASTYHPPQAKPGIALTLGGDNLVYSDF